MRITLMIANPSEKSVMSRWRNIESIRPVRLKTEREKHRGMTESWGNSGKGTLRALPRFRPFFQDLR